MKPSQPVAAETESLAPDASEWREVGCALCGSRESRLRFRDGNFRVLECVPCQLTYVSPRQVAASLLREVYAEDYWRSDKPRVRGYSDYRGDRDLYLRSFRRRLDGLRQLLPAGGRALDVGCAAGFFLEVLDPEHWEVFGLEASPSIAKVAQEQLGEDRIQVAELARAELAEARFDLITMWDVLEHLPDPVQDLKRLARSLAPGGRLVIETQDIDSLAARCLGRRWHHFKHREHLHHFSPLSLEKALGLAGLRLVALHRRGAGKYVRGDFLVERSARLHPSLPKLIRPVIGGSWSIYVNLGDEMIAVAEVAP